MFYDKNRQQYTKIAVYFAMIIHIGAEFCLKSHLDFYPLTLARNFNGDFLVLKL